MRTAGLVAAALAVAVATAAVVALRMHAREPDAGGPVPVAAAQTRVVTLSVPEMDCAGCAVGVKVAAGRIEGVQDVKVDLDARTVEVSFDPSETNPEAIADAISRGTGFTVKAKVSSGEKVTDGDRSDT